MKKKPKLLLVAVVVFAVCAAAAVLIFTSAPAGKNTDAGRSAAQDAGTASGPAAGTDRKTSGSDGSKTPSENAGNGATDPAASGTPAGPDPVQSEVSAIAQGTVKSCAVKFGSLMLINPNFTVGSDWIAARRSQLIDIDETYGIKEGNHWNGRPLLDRTAAAHLNDMLKAYSAEYPGHTMTTRSCFRSYGTSCGRLCFATGTTDHHTGLTCDLVDDQSSGGDSTLDTDALSAHPEWQWLHENSWKFGFIDRFPENWAGGPMTAPVNVDANGTTGLYETWHYRYVGLAAAAEIASGKYNGGDYDSLEHYLKASGRIRDLLDPDSCL